MNITWLKRLRQNELLADWQGHVTETDILACRKILHATIDKLLEVGPQKIAADGPTIVTEAVLALNEIDSGFICTIEREDLCEFFEELGERSGLSAGDIEEVLENREW